MTVLQGYTVTFSDRTASYDTTDRVQGFTTTVSAPIGEFGRMNAVLELQNYDGAFTPEAAGGNGTYKSIDWQRQKLNIRADFNLRNVEIFDGVIRTIDITDDGQSSIVRITAVDWFQAFTGDVGDITADGFSQEIYDAITFTVEGESGWGPGFSFPEFGDPTVPTNVIPAARSATYSNIERPAASSVTAKDYINNVIMPSGPYIAWPGGIGFQTGSTPFTNFGFYYIDSTLNKNVTYTIDFDENPSNPSTTTTTLPITTLRIAQRIDDVINEATVASAVTGLTPQTAVNQTSIDNYGQRTLYYGSTANETEQDALDVANFWVNRAGTPRFSPSSITVRSSTIDALLTSDAYLKMSYLMSYSEPIWTRSAVTYTPTGGVSTTVQCVIVGRTINATPSDTVITVEMLPALDYQSFELDSSTFGILGGTVQNYDDTGDPDTYDSIVAYDGETIQGNRLG